MKCNPPPPPPPMDPRYIPADPGNVHIGSVRDPPPPPPPPPPPELIHTAAGTAVWPAGGADPTTVE